MTYQELLKNVKLRVTPQRIAVLDAISQRTDHPSAEDISNAVRLKYPNIAIGTIYNILDTFSKTGIINHVKTDKGSMLYDFILEKHHHLYCNNTDRIEDYYDEELDTLLEEYFKKKKINGFTIDDIKLQLVGKFKSQNL